jgi:hypothetical protein
MGQGTKKFDVGLSFTPYFRDRVKTLEFHPREWVDSSDPTYTGRLKD